MKDKLKKEVLQAIDYYESQEIDLSSDWVEIKLTYPERPDILVQVVIGGMFPLGESISDEVH